MPSPYFNSMENSWALIMHCCRIVNGIKNKNIKNAKRIKTARLRRKTHDDKMIS